MNFGAITIGATNVFVIVTAAVWAGSTMFTETGVACGPSETHTGSTALDDGIS